MQNERLPLDVYSLFIKVVITLSCSNTYSMEKSLNSHDSQLVALGSED